MCAFCAMMADGSVHWTEAGTDAGQSGAPESGRERYLGRLRRVSLVNRILDHYGCQASDWANNQYVVRAAPAAQPWWRTCPRSGRQRRKSPGAPSTPWTRPCSMRCAAPTWRLANSPEFSPRSWSRA